MRAILTPDISNRLGIVMFKPGSEVMSLFRQGRVMISPVPADLAEHPSGSVPPAIQLLQDDPALLPILENQRVILTAGGISSLDAWLEQKLECQWPHASWHSEHYTVMRHAPGSIRLCWACDNELRECFAESLATIARKNLVSWLIETMLRDLGFSEDHTLTYPELCWWLVRNNLGDVIPESAARKALRIPEEEHKPVMRECDIVPGPPVTEILQEKAKKVLALNVDPETPEAFMLKPKRRRWVNEKYTRWVKSQQCVCCNQPADDPHHIIGHGMGGMGTKSHDLFVIPLCRAHHDALHADTVAFEEKYGSQVELWFRFIDRALAIGVLA
ncbi:hypothetical protein ABW06_24790 [Pluralibacter gergoviae]|uniref:HNH nuclease domain-containing protein n=1 Tax=Pluralibacter gergoviae TaxID=61647 RepID=A0A0J5NIE9_PLUGE|nr:DUF968 domain-containing protein [Pluralibacter gergoviae]KMK08162.1 hypothetical protein ABW06_24790 [Pluralibacter gergoviae]